MKLILLSVLLRTKTPAVSNRQEKKHWGKQVHVKLRFMILLLVLRRKCDEPFSPVISYRRKLEQATILKDLRFVIGECEKHCTV